MVLRQGIRGGLVSFFLLLTMTCAQAGTMEKLTCVKDHLKNFYKDYHQNFEISGAGGVNWYNVDNTHLVVSPFENDSLRVNQDSNSSNGTWKVGIGYYLIEDILQQRKYLNHLLFEANVYGTSTTLTGRVWQYELSKFDNYKFRAHVESTRLMFDFKPYILTWRKISPYAILGVGAAWNSVSYREQVTDHFTPRASALSLSEKTSTHVAWDVGAGFSYAITDCFSATAEYVYAFLGEGSPAHGPTHGVRLSSPPNFSLETQSLLFGLSLRL